MKVRLTLAWLIAFVGLPAQSEVTVASQSGFTSVHEITLVGTPAAAYHALTEQVRHWWDASHSYSGKAAHFTLDARAGGCFCERLDNGGSVEHMRVVYADPDKRLVMQGGLGPLQTLGVHGSMIFEIEPRDEVTTVLRYRYEVGGFTQGGLESWAEPVDRVQLGQLQRLQQYLSTNKPLN